MDDSLWRSSTQGRSASCQSSLNHQQDSLGVSQIWRLLAWQVWPSASVRLRKTDGLGSSALAKHQRLELEDVGVLVLPGAPRQPGLHACLLQKRLPVPAF